MVALAASSCSLVLRTPPILLVTLVKKMQAPELREQLEPRGKLKASALSLLFVGL